MKKCERCGSENIKHRLQNGRGLPASGWVRRMGDRRLISWKGVWDIWTCGDCRNEVKKLRRK